MGRRQDSSGEQRFLADKIERQDRGMDQFDRQKELRRAMGARTALLAGGLMLLFTSITSTVTYGINFIMRASEADKGVEEILKLLQDVGMDSMTLRIIGICFLVVGAMEIFSGVCGFRFSNRLDKSELMLKIVIALLAVEVAMQVFLFFVKMMSPGLLFSALVIPLFMLWGVLRLRKLAKDDPDRVYVVNTGKGNPRYTAPGTKPGPERSMRERAMVKPKTEQEAAKPEKIAEAKPEESELEAETVKPMEEAEPEKPSEVVEQEEE